MSSKWNALSTRRVVSALVLVGLVVIGIGMGLFRSTPVQAECAAVYFKNSTSGGYCAYGHGPCDPAGC